MTPTLQEEAEADKPRVSPLDEFPDFDRPRTTRSGSREAEDVMLGSNKAIIKQVRKLAFAITVDVFGLHFYLFYTVLFVS